METQLTQDMDRVTSEIQKQTGFWINPGSGDQVADLLFNKMGLKQAHPKLTASGERESVEDEVLTAIQHEHPVVGLCLEYKEFEKLLGTYVRPMPKLAKRTEFGVWRMYPNLRTTRVPSGRLSCTNPNLLAMPSRTKLGREIRKGFITDPGWVILSTDLSQIEPRIAAHRSQDPALISIYQNGEDIYSDFATAAFRLKDERHRDAEGWHYPTVSKTEHRRPAKTCVLAALYAVTGSGLQEQMPIMCANCNKEAAVHTCKKFTPLWIEAKCQNLIDSFYRRYCGLLRMQIDDHHYMRQHAYSLDLFGRILHVQAVRSVLPWVVNGALREGSNFPIQSTASGILKLSMAAIDADIAEAKMYGDVCNILLFIHDELLWEVRADVAEDLAALNEYRMATAVQLRVPIKAASATANSWGEVEK
jgi:DNA polymerase-1